MILAHYQERRRSSKSVIQNKLFVSQSFNRNNIELKTIEDNEGKSQDKYEKNNNQQTIVERKEMTKRLSLSSVIDNKSSSNQQEEFKQIQNASELIIIFQPCIYIVEDASKSNANIKIQSAVISTANAQKSSYFFNEFSEKKEQRIRENSPYKNLKTWKTAHFIIKSGDNLKQEQFSMQLIDQFQQIFALEKIDLRLFTYEIISLGLDHNYIVYLRAKLWVDLISAGYDYFRESQIEALRGLQFNAALLILSLLLQQHYIIQLLFQIDTNFPEAQKNFCKSLAAYSLICYILQVKDRHNGNILLHCSGSLVHIDFGFLLSNAPGKGLEFEKPVPFKLINEYVEVLGGKQNELFKEFRKLIFLGYKAIIKHQEKILILVKMMFSGHGQTLPCFKGGCLAIIVFFKGEVAIQQLEDRLNPLRGNDNDAQLNIFIQKFHNYIVSQIVIQSNKLKF